MADIINILLIEDNPADIKLVEISLTEAFAGSYSLAIAKTLSESMQYKGKPDIIISDISLPDSQGMDTFIKVYKANPKTPVIVLTGYGDEAFGIQAVQKGAADFLIKSELNSSLLKRTIIYSIERRRLIDKFLTYTEKLEMSEKRLTAAHHFAKMGHWEWDLVNNTTQWSDELYRIYGYMPNQIKVSYDWFLQQVHPEDLELVKQNVEQRFQNCKPFDYYFRIISADHSIKIIHRIDKVFTDEKGNVIRMSGIDHDITDILKALRDKNNLSIWTS